MFILEQTGQYTVLLIGSADTGSPEVRRAFAEI